MKTRLSLLILTILFASIAGAAERPRATATTHSEGATEVALPNAGPLGVAFRALRSSLGLASDELPVEASACDSFAGTLFCNSNITTGYLGGSDCYLPDTKTYVDFYKLNVAAGQTVTVRASTSRSYTILVAFQDINSGVVLKANYGTGSVNVTYAPPASSVVSIGFLEDYATGDYTLSVSCGTTSEPPANGCTPVAALNCGSSPAIGSLASTDCKLGASYYADVYTVNATKGEPMDVTVTAEFPVYIAFETSSEGAWVQGNRTMTLSYTPSSTGPHNVYVSSLDELVTGGYTIAVKCAGAAPCRTRAVRH